MMNSEDPFHWDNRFQPMIVSKSILSVLFQ